MKKIIMGDTLYEKMSESIDLLCNTVKVTLGPKGSNVIIDHSTFNPFITNDGVTIAENIESNKEDVNTILELAKEASIKTNEKVGDGTTTTLVLLQSIFHYGLKYIKEGINPIILKKELDNNCDNVVSMIKKYMHIPSNEEVINIAKISSNDNNIGNIVGNVYLNILNKNGIILKESNREDTIVNYLKGYVIDTILASNIFLSKKREIEYLNSYILLVNNTIDDINNIANIINKIMIDNSNLVIIANDYSDLFIQEILELNIDNNINIILLKTPLYSYYGVSILEDLEVLSNGKIVSNNYDISNLGLVDNIKINNNETIISFKYNNNIKKHMMELSRKLDNDEDYEFNAKRLTMFKNGTAEILIGAKTVTERREAKMRYEDALSSINEAYNGVVVGSGITYLRVSEELNNDNIANVIFKEALKCPFKQIMSNAGLNGDEILEEIKKSNYNKVYNVLLDSYEEAHNTKVLDAVNILINAFLNATSIAGMLLTTTHLVINEYQNNMNKINDYNEL